MTMTGGRSPFLKDWDRIVFSSAFRRLQDKTQVHSLPKSDYVRTRLTHSLEASSVGRSLGALVGPILVERHFPGGEVRASEFGHIVAAACLAHDIGNPPFGHFGEAVIRRWFADKAGGFASIAALTLIERADFLGFDGNAQGFRILTRLANWRDKGGLRLTAATLAGFSKYPNGSLAADGSVRSKFGFFQAEAEFFEEIAAEVGLIPQHRGQARQWCRHPLAYLVEAADDICYRIVDWEDGYKLGRIDFATAESQLRNLIGALSARYGDIEEEPWRIAYLRAQAIGELIEQVANVFLAEEQTILQGRFEGELLPRTKAWPALARIDERTRERIFASRERARTEVRATKILCTLLAALTEALASREESAALAKAKLKPASGLLSDLLSDGSRADTHYQRLLRIVDFVAGMTDRYALRQSRKWRDRAQALSASAAGR
jgi:dGTPase